MQNYHPVIVFYMLFIKVDLFQFLRVKILPYLKVEQSELSFELDFSLE